MEDRYKQILTLYIPLSSNLYPVNPKPVTKSEMPIETHPYLDNPKYFTKISVNNVIQVKEVDSTNIFLNPAVQQLKTEETKILLDVNLATSEELESNKLPEAVINKIIKTRPFFDVDEFNKKIKLPFNKKPEDYNLTVIYEANK